LTVMFIQCSLNNTAGILGNKTDGIGTGAGIFKQHCFFKGIAAVRQKGVTDLLQHTIDMANDWDSAKQKFTQFDKSPADIISHTKPGDKEDQNKCQ